MKGMKINDKHAISSKSDDTVKAEKYIRKERDSWD